MKLLFCTGLILSVFLLYSCSEQENPPALNPAKKEVNSSKHIDYYENGNKKTEGTLQNGKKQGKWIAYYSNGYKWSEVTYINGVRQGPTQTYYENGIMRYQGNYANDERSGIWFFYDEEGVLIKRVNSDEKESIDSLKTN